jgi:hypothetical protein
MRIWNDQDKALGHKPRRFPAAARYALFLWIPLLLLFGLWRPGGVPVAVLLNLVLGVAALCHIGWASARRRRLAPDSAGRRRRELLDAIEKHGGLSPEARTAASKIAERRPK